MPIIDFHNHYYPPKYLDALRSGRSSVKVTADPDGNPVIHYPGDYNVAVRGHRDLAYRADVLDEHGITMQVLSLTTPGTQVETPQRAAEFASLVNDEFREAMETRGRHFTALATLPLNDPKAATRELERACRAHIDRPPSTYLREFYFDTVNFDVRALELAIAFAGAKQVLAGSDYPHQIGSIRSMLDAVGKLSIPENDRAGILGFNAAKLLALEVNR